MTGLFAVNFGDIALSSVIFCSIASLFAVAVKVVNYRITVAMDRHYDREPVRYAGFDYDPSPMTDIMDSVRDPFPADEAPELDEDTARGPDGRHAVAPESAAEMTQYAGIRVVGDQR